MQVHHSLRKSAESLPDKEALVNGSRRLTFAEIETHSNGLAHALKAIGLQKLDRVAIYLENSIEAVISVFGILQAGCVLTIINPQTRARRLEYILNDCQVKGLITRQELLSTCLPDFNNLPWLNSLLLVGESSPDAMKQIATGVKISLFWDLIKEFPGNCPDDVCSDSDLCSINYTSGSTGNPKGVMLTHSNMIAATQSITEYLENSVDDIVINVLPLSFDYGFYNILMPFYFGGTVILEKAFISPHQLIGLVKKEKVTGLPLVPTIIGLLLKFSHLQRYDLSAVKYITSTGQALPTAHILQFHELFSKARIYSMYGLTECKRVSYLPPHKLLSKPNSVGKAMPRVEVYLINGKGNTIAQPGETGELIVKGPNVMQGYWNLPEKTANALKKDEMGEKVLHTGDLFKMDEDGYLYFVGRKDDLIKTAGERVSPKEIEDVIYQLEGIDEAAVYGVADEILGQAIKLTVTLKEGSDLTRESIGEYCSKYLEKFMLPKHIEIKSELPKTSNGKINKRALKDSN